MPIQQQAAVLGLAPEREQRCVSQQEFYKAGDTVPSMKANTRWKKLAFRIVAASLLSSADRSPLLS